MIKIKKLSKEDFNYTDYLGDMKFFLEKARKNWKKAVLESKTSDYMKDYITNEKVRGKLTEFMERELKIPGKSKVLEIGAGMGALTLALSRRFNVSAIDADLSSLTFVKYRAEQEKVKLKLFNTKPLHNGLPFKNNSFDIVVMNGVLEWVGVGFPKIGKVKDVQLKILKDVKRILKKNGMLILAIENRLSPQWFKGKTSHISIKFIDLMPRFLANIISRIKRKEDFRAYIYTKSGYKKILKQAGFQNLEFYEAYPNYQKPRFIKKSASLSVNSYIILAKP